MQTETTRLRMLVAIVDRGKGDRLAAFYTERGVKWHYVCPGHGTATSDVLDMLGLGVTEKDVLISVAPGSAVVGMMKAFREQRLFKGPGTGIAFSLPLSAVSGALSRMLNHGVPAQEKGESITMENSGNYDLVLVAVESGFSDTVMDAARAAGARGGTLVHARSLSSEDTEKFAGVSIQAAREIIAILTKRDQKQAIMQAVAAAAGLNTKARGILLALPVDDMTGIG